MSAYLPESSTESPAPLHHRRADSSRLHPHGLYRRFHATENAERFRDQFPGTPCHEEVDSFRREDTVAAWPQCLLACHAADDRNPALVLPGAAGVRRTQREIRQCPQQGREWFLLTGGQLPSR